MGTLGLRQYFGLITNYKWLFLSQASRERNLGMKPSLLVGVDVEGGAHERVTAHQASLNEGLSSDESTPPSAWRAFQSTEGRTHIAISLQTSASSITSPNLTSWKEPLTVLGPIWARYLLSERITWSQDPLVSISVMSPFPV